jgi:hypothetical protein
METDIFDEEAPPAPELTQDKPFTWAGQPLGPYSFGRKLVFQGLTGPEDDPPARFYTLGLLYILLGSEQDAQRWLYSVKTLRTEVAQFLLNRFEEKDYQEACDVINEILARAKRKVSAEPKPGAALEAEKKT